MRWNIGEKEKMTNKRLVRKVKELEDQIKELKAEILKENTSHIGLAEDWEITDGFGGRIIYFQYKGYYVMFIGQDGKLNLCSNMGNSNVPFEVDENGSIVLGDSSK